VAADLLRDPNVARLAAARFVSTFGTAMAPVAMAFGVLDLTGSPSMVGAVLASQTAAQVAVQLFGGALADRWSRQRMMVGAEILATVSQTAMAMLLFAESDRVWALAALMAVNGIAFALFYPASVGIVPQLVTRDRLQPANAILTLAQSGAFALGGAVAGLVVALAGAGWAIALDAVSFAVSASLVAGLRPGPQERGEPTHLWRQLRDGWREFTAHRWLWTIVLQFSLLVAGWQGGLNVVGPVVAKRELGGAAAWGWVTGALGVGLLVGGLVGMRVTFRRPLLVATFAILMLAFPLVALAAGAPLPAVVGGAFLAGLGGQVFSVIWYTALHTRVAPEALSRVSAYDSVGSIAFAPLGEAAAGPLIETLGARETLWWASALVIVPTLAVLGVPEVRRLGPEVGGAAREDRAAPRATG
jgi:MFS family permease